MPEKKSKKTALGYELKNGYEKLGQAEEKQMEAVCSAYMNFLAKSKTERAAHDEAVALVENAGYKNLETLIAKKTALKQGDRIYASCAGKTIMALVIGRRPLEEGMHIVGGHTDAPRLDLKQNPLYENSELAYFDTHYYGGIKKYQWVTIPLALYGVFALKNGKILNVAIGDKPGDPVFCISDLLPHLAQHQNQKKLGEAIGGEDLDVIVASRPVTDKNAKQKVKEYVLKHLNKEYGVKEADFLSAELEIVPAGAPREVGFDRALILGYGHDDRVCAYSALQALLDLPAVPQYTACALMCDKEEIGSAGATGMESNFFENMVAELVALQSGADSELAVKRCMRKSKLLSADVNAAFDPMFPGVSDKRNSCMVNYGTCLTKYTGARGKSGANDANAEFVAEVRYIFDEAKVAWQTGELGKVDQGGGGTIAAIMARYGMDVVDCGVPLLSMHAPSELASKFDIYMTYKGFRAFFSYSRNRK
ncbi:MAG: aminopeptidase [Elusimicrobiaceae bacterium]|nr:aminopeptidase [Elusimicrobiaceae bacterium]